MNTEKKNEEILILGGGIAGISAAYHLDLNGYSNCVFEGRSIAGGLVSNFEVSGFRFDHAIHMSFSNIDYVKKIWARTPYISHRPDAFCLERSVWLKHPVQNNLYPLPTSDKVDLIESFIDRPNISPANYRDWLYHQYGSGISKRFPIPYTRKYWCVEPEALTIDWIGNRMRRANIHEVLAGAFEDKDENQFYASEMRYPAKGGYFEFVKEITESVNLYCNKLVKKIDVKKKLVSCSDGSSTKYKHLISSLPLPIICNMIDSCPKEVLSAANRLKWTTVDLISIGFRKPDVSPYLWFYLYDESNLASRAYSPSMKSPNNAPKDCSSLQFEIYNLCTNPKLDPELLKQNILEHLLAMGICEEEDIIFMHHKHLPFGNVIFDHEMRANRKTVINYLEGAGIFSCGRFGEWDYLWSDQSFMSGKKVSQKLASCLED